MKKLLLLHGALGSEDQFEPLLKLLAPHFDLYTLNFDGHGGNDLHGEFSIDRFVNNVFQYLEKNKISMPFEYAQDKPFGFAQDKCNFFGYSMGGYVAMKFASMYPQITGDIMTLGTKFNWNKDSAENEVKMLNPEVVEVKIPKFAEQLRLRHHPSDWKLIMDKTADMMLQLGNGMAMKKDDFEKIQQRVLITVGSEDKMVTQEESKSVVQLLKHGEFKMMEGFKHPIEMVDSKILAETIIECFRGRDQNYLNI